MGSASNRLRNVVIGGRSSLMPLKSVTSAPLHLEACSEQFDLARDQRQVELAQSVARVGAFQIVLGRGTGPGRRSDAGRA